MKYELHSGELMPKSFVYNDRIEGMLRQNDLRMVLSSKLSLIQGS